MDDEYVVLGVNENGEKLLIKKPNAEPEPHLAERSEEVHAVKEN